MAACGSVNMTPSSSSTSGASRFAESPISCGVKCGLAKSSQHLRLLEPIAALP